MTTAPGLWDRKAAHWGLFLLATFTVDIHPLAREEIKCEVGLYGTEVYREESGSQPALLPRN